MHAVDPAAGRRLNDGFRVTGEAMQPTRRVRRRWDTPQRGAARLIAGSFGEAGRGLAMALGPFPSEQVHDPEFERLVESLCVRPQMYASPATYGAVCAYLCGFDAARSGGPLMGLREWLVVRAGDGNNLPWSGLARRQLPQDHADAELPDEERAIRALGRLLAEFFEYRRANGITKVYHEYARWLLRQSWYTGPLRRGPRDRA
jgi:hypothetical protein